MTYAAGRTSTALAVIGLVLAVAGVMLLTPAVVAAIGRVSANRPLAVRIAGRELARYQSRSAAALGAVALALAIPMGVGVVTATIDARESAEPVNVPENAAIIWAPDARGDGVPASIDLEPGLSVVERLPTVAPDVGVIPIEVAVDAASGFTTGDGIEARIAIGGLTEIPCGSTHAETVWNMDGACFTGEASWVATPQLTELWSLPAPTRDAAGSPTVIARDDRARFLPVDGGDNVLPASVLVADIPEFVSFPDTLVAASDLPASTARATIGWLLTAEEPLDAALVAELRSSMTSGLELETIEVPSSDASLRTLAALVGALAGLCILGATLMLFRGEGVEDARLMTMLGARSWTRRAVAGSTAGLLALAGAVLALPLGYLGLIIARASESEAPFVIPWSTLAITLVAFPLVATLVTGALSGERSQAIAQRPR